MTRIMESCYLLSIPKTKINMWKQFIEYSIIHAVWLMVPVPSEKISLFLLLVINLIPDLPTTYIIIVWTLDTTHIYRYYI
jgi:hypothetical protein